MTNKCKLENDAVESAFFTITDTEWTKITLDTKVKRERFIISIRKQTPALQVFLIEDNTLSDDHAIEAFTGNLLMDELTCLTGDIYAKLGEPGEAHLVVKQSKFDGKR